MLCIHRILFGLCQDILPISAKKLVGRDALHFRNWWPILNVTSVLIFSFQNVVERVGNNEKIPVNEYINQCANYSLESKCQDLKHAQDC